MPRFLHALGLMMFLAGCGGGGGKGSSDDGGEQPLNQAPTVTSSSFEVEQEGELTGTLTARDPENNAVTFGKTSEPAHGEIVSFAASGAFVYRPDTAFVGTDSFNVSASDGTHTVAATITLTIKEKVDGGEPPLNEAPTLNSASFEVEQEGELTGTLTASDPENDAVTFSSTSFPTHGQLVSFQSSGAFTYRPDASFVGTDSFNVSASDGTHTVTATITLTIKAKAVSQSVNFTQAGPLNVFVGDTLSNVASGPGTGAVTYSSSNVSTATVDEHGMVTVKAPGSAEIRADKTADAAYLSAQVSYRLNSVDRRVSFTSWTGAHGGEVRFPASAAGLEFYRSSAPGCDLANYSSCVDGQMDILNGSPVMDTAATLSRVGYYSLKHGDHVTELALGAARFGERYDHQVVVFQDRLWLIGGDDGSRNNDVWSSRDGITWTQQAADAAFSPRSDHRVVVSQGRLWLIGGNDDDDASNDVWCSSDGITWTQQTASAAFSARSDYQVVVHDDQLWLIGGDDGSRKNDVWSSSDGVDWRIGLRHRLPVSLTTA